MRDQEQKKLLVAELAGEPPLIVAQERIAPGGDHREGVAAAQEARIGARALLPIEEETVVAVALVEVGEMMFGDRRHIALAGSGAEGEPDIVVLLQRGEAVEDQIGHHRHPVIFDLPEAQGTGLRAGVGHERAQQIFPVTGDARGARGARRTGSAGGSRVGGREHLAAPAEPFERMWAVDRLARLPPAGRVRPPEAIDDVLDRLQRQRLGGEFEGQDHRIDLVEEIKVVCVTSQTIGAPPGSMVMRTRATSSRR